MQFDNPWIKTQCAVMGITQNQIETLLQEQYGQLGEDLMAEGLLKSLFSAGKLLPHEVRYLEVGANHPIQTNNTYLFTRKWGGRGVLVEANPFLIEALCKVRPKDKIINAAVIPNPQLRRVQLNIANYAELSSVDPEHVNSFGERGQISGYVDVPALTLDEILEKYFDNEVHLMSIDIEGLDWDVLNSSRLVRRPWVIIVEPSRHYHIDAEYKFYTLMTKHGYIEASRTDYNLLYVDAVQISKIKSSFSAPASNLKRTTSFDIFDTLVARRCIFPSKVFEVVEERSGRVGFAGVRIAAEASFGDQEYSITDIYQFLGNYFGLDTHEIQSLMDLELAVEMENVIPIADTIDNLEADSILISDTYLPQHIIRQILQRVGVLGHPVLITSAHGKRSGRVWNGLSNAGILVHHSGDNVNSDLHQAQIAGHSAKLVTKSTPTPTESEINAAGLPLLARVLREARLTSPAGKLENNCLRLQSELNLPVLVTSALHLLTAASDDPSLRILFCSRDARYLKQIYDAIALSLMRPYPQSHYWYTSRLVRVKGDSVYLRYCRSLIGQTAWIVDLCGTGASFAALREHLDIGPSQTQFFVCELIDSPKQTSELLKAYGVKAWLPPAAIWTDKNLVENEILEFLNYVPEGMVVGVKEVLGGYIPLRDQLEFSPSILESVKAQECYINAYCKQLADAVGIVGESLLKEFSNSGFHAKLAISRIAPNLSTEISELVRSKRPEHRRMEESVKNRLEIMTKR